MIPRRKMSPAAPSVAESWTNGIETPPIYCDRCCKGWDTLPVVEDEPIHIWCDGFCSNNRQPAARAGWSIVAFTMVDGLDHRSTTHSGLVLRPMRQTNNVAEYKAVIAALELVQEEGWDGAVIHSDSQLVLNQVSGKWECHKEHLIPLLSVVRNLMAQMNARLVWESGERMKQVLGH